MKVIVKYQLHVEVIKMTKRMQSNISKEKLTIEKIEKRQMCQRKLIRCVFEIFVHLSSFLKLQK